MASASLDLYLFAGAALFALGFHGVIRQPHLLKKILGVNIMGNGVFLIYVTIAMRTPGPIPDPIPHAMVLTGIVVSVCATGLALALADRVQQSCGKAEIDEDGEE
jgi:multicomponent Na+:H+ antiporter subunit C